MVNIVDFVWWMKMGKGKVFPMPKNFVCIQIFFVFKTQWVKKFIIYIYNIFMFFVDRPEVQIICIYFFCSFHFRFMWISVHFVLFIVVLYFWVDRLYWLDILLWLLLYQIYIFMNLFNILFIMSCFLMIYLISLEIYKFDFLLFWFFGFN